MQLYKQLIKTFGSRYQILIAIEELSELQKELIKYLRNKNNQDHISEEMADVDIMLYQLRLIFKNDKKIDQYIKKKTKRTQQRYLHKSDFWCTII